MNVRTDLAYPDDPAMQAAWERGYLRAEAEAEGLADAVRPLIEHRIGLYVLAAEKVGLDAEQAMAVIEDRDPFLAKAAAALRGAQTAA